MTAAPFCSRHSQATGQPLYGTASQVRVWLLLEHAGSWPGQWLEGNDLPTPLQAWTQQLEATIPHSRVAFIKRDRPSASRALYLATTDPTEPRLYRLAWRAYPELLDLDVAAILAGDSDLEPVAETLALVCTHGRRDRCCAKFGLPIYQAFQQQPELTVWQCTHLGGHRFAANAVILPSGVCYGYLTPGEAGAVAEATLRGEIHLASYRGRSFHDGVTNAAEYFVRRETGTSKATGLNLESAEQQGETHRVTFRNGRSRHRIELTSTLGEPQLVSCGKPLKPQPHYTLVRHQLLDNSNP